jgi:hypothetical protein
VVLVQQRAGMAGHNSHRGGGDPVGVAQPAQPASAQHGVDGRAGQAYQWRQALRAVAALGPGTADALLDLRRQASRRTVRPARAIEQSDLAFESVAIQP